MRSSPAVVIEDDYDDGCEEKDDKEEDDDDYDPYDYMIPTHDRIMHIRIHRFTLAMACHSNN